MNGLYDTGAAGYRQRVEGHCKAGASDAYLLFSADSRFRIDNPGNGNRSVIVKYKKEAGLHGKHC